MIKKCINLINKDLNFLPLVVNFTISAIPPVFKLSYDTQEGHWKIQGSLQSVYTI